MRNVFQKALWDQRRSLPFWASGVALVVLLEAALWPSMANMTTLDDYLRDLPPALREVFSLDQMATGAGFLNAELFTLVLPMIFLVFAITRGARMLAGEEEAGTLDLLLVTPLSATRLLVQEAAALTLSIAVLGTAVWGATVIGGRFFGLGISLAAATVGAIALVLLGFEFGMLALVTGALTGRRGLAVGVPAALVLAAYLLFVAGALVNEFTDWRRLSPFDQALHAGPLAAQLPASFVWLVVPPMLALVTALPFWSRRDIGIGR
ncbi:ABC transporter permease subunit [Nocardioides sp. Soil796]|uniref:ABC transporter permease subunit n=1 Tax=Nocardioides sp. Soil796 TaxID=1736412 RepID=UPI0009EC3E16|nr:ABC transporter permease subunit [Nocardioides sp. Soil796]